MSSCLLGFWLGLCGRISGLDDLLSLSLMGLCGIIGGLVMVNVG